MTAGNRFTICALVASAFSVCSLDSKFFGCFLNTFKDAKVTFRARTECLKRLLVRLAFVCRERDIIAIKFDDDSPLLQSSLVGLNLACGQGQKASAVARTERA